MSHFLVNTTPEMAYVDRHELLRSLLSEDVFRSQRQELLLSSDTIYVGNLSFYTREEQLMTHFGSCGTVREIIMGLNEATREPCGFCFIVYTTHDAATRAIHLLHHSLLDDRVISVGWDVGCEWQRRWGRGAEGNQVVDGVRQNVDDGRGGLGVLRRSALGVSLPDTLQHRETTSDLHTMSFSRSRSASLSNKLDKQANADNAVGTLSEMVNSDDRRACYYWVVPHRHKRSASDRRELSAQRKGRNEK